MKILSKEFQVKTKSRFESIDITDLVQESIKGVNEGIAYVIVKHTTCAITINEAERGLMSDYIEWAKKLVPPEGEFRHNIIDNNGHAHVISSIIGNSRVVPITGGTLDLGTWQRIILLEFDGPRTRTVLVKVMGE
ncbi:MULTISPECIES: secondary thiamine-phosphate synthase enzyme YjbQ [unclassified Stygiolobus]|jgi:secondary thiamine-phosphate synthase enzyme|uniref:secondary thiamine-phosphate synthase enzyme YjbQ n=1 Tax=unclassified Stygiolobus TaxID=2824672 RepID=UPI0028CE70E7|nr:secondary thiamine-phosphate synthase enzyme YjbQ [Sulfolobaceae archaeon]